MAQAFKQDFYKWLNITNKDTEAGGDCPTGSRLEVSQHRLVWDVLTPTAHLCHITSPLKEDITIDNEKCKGWSKTTINNYLPTK